MSWELPPLTTLALVLLTYWWFRSRPLNQHRVLYAALLCAAISVDGYHRMMQRLYLAAHDAVFNVSFDQLLSRFMLIAAITWMLYRTAQVLVKPTDELVEILGIDIPETPDVCLAGIRSDAATLTWSKPTSGRAVQRYLIQVNGVQVGDLAGNDAAITVTGLKPSHFYNIRVVAVGQNNFRSGSAVIRLRTFAKDGRPQLGNGRLPTNFVDPAPAQARAESTDDLNCADDVGDPFPTVEAAHGLEGASIAPRDAAATALPGPRRNTGNRRHSPSVASADQAATRAAPSSDDDLSLAELTEKFESIRKEIEDTQHTYDQEKEEGEHLIKELVKERDRKRQALKAKEEQTSQLKAQVRTTMEQMRAVEKERDKKQQQLKDREAKKSKVRDSIAHMEDEIDRMRKEREGFEVQKVLLKQKRDKRVRELDESNANTQRKIEELEAELKDKGKQLQDLKATRGELPGADDEQWKEDDDRMRRDWEVHRAAQHAKLVEATKYGYQLDQYIRYLSDQLTAVQNGTRPVAPAFFGQNPSAVGLELDGPGTAQGSQGFHLPGNPMSSTPMSSPPPLAAVEPNFQGTAGFSHGTFAPGLFMDMPRDRATEPQTEAELKAASGPLSPSAQKLLPSNIFDDGEDLDSRDVDSAQLPDPVTIDEDGAQSPVSPSLSFGVLSSPYASSQNLPFPKYVDSNDRASLHANTSPVPAPATTQHRLTSLLSNFHRSGRAPRPDDGDGPRIGSLKSGQSQSFPRGTTDEMEATESRRRIFPWANRNSTGPDSSSGASNYFSGRRVNSLRASRISNTSEHDLQRSRPPSIASTDLPRPSTDSSSIWGAPGDAKGPKNRFWSPSDNMWPSRNGSRRPSLHGSTTALTTTLASADDEILDEDALLDPHTSPSQVGVIGSRPPRASKSLMNQRLNPTAPTFMGNIFRKDKDKDRIKDKSKQDQGKAKEVITPSIELPSNVDDSPSDSRISRDTYSMRTDTSISESRESLQLDSTASNTPSDINSTSTSNMKDSENVVKKLFRKGSSSKFSLSSRLGKESGLFKKGSGSAANSDRNASAEQGSSIGDVDDIGEDATQFGRSYDSMTSSPALGPAKSKDSRESRMSSWRFSMKKKSKDTPALKEKESLDLERATDEE